MIKMITEQQATSLLNSNETFIINNVASWCSDCVKQSENIDSFAAYFAARNIPVYQLNVQDIKNEYLSAAHEEITMRLGGRGYPRTVLVKEGGIVDADNVEIITMAELNTLAERFLSLL